jgi:uncharacterized protein YbjT (DUF2867 family)
MVGGLVARMALASDEVEEVRVLSRRPTGLTGPGLSEVLHRDLGDLSGVEEAFAGLDAALFCVGAYTGGVPDEEFRRVTVDMAVAAGRAVRAGSPGAAFCLLSGQGADQSEKSRVAFARYKGMAENALRGMDFPRLHLFRPGYIYPVDPRDEPSALYAALRVMWPVARRLYPNVGISSADLAAAMLEAALHGTPGHDRPELENRDIRTLAS